MFFPDRQTFLSIGGLSVKWYAIMILLGVFAVYYFSCQNFKKNGYSKSILEDIFFGCFLWGLVGARIWYCLFSYPSYYFENPIRFLYIFEGGLAIQGGLMAGAIYGIWYAKKHNMSFLRAADAIVPNILIGQVIGRWGNFINQEAYGGIVDATYFKYYPEFIKNGMYIDGSYRQPTFLWESLYNLIGFILISTVYKKAGRNKRGDMVYIYLIWYGIGRFFIEGFRTDSLMIFSLKMSQVISIVFIVLGLLGIFGGFNRFIKVKKPTVIFDLDGTLLDTKPAIHASYQHVFETFGYSQRWTDDLALEVLGPPLKEIFERYIPEVETKKLIAEYRKHNESIHHSHVHLIENVQYVLETLYNEGYTLSIVSSKLKEGILLGLRQFDIEKYFECIIGLDDVTSPKPNPEGILIACATNHDACVYIGDSVSDMQAGESAGVYTVGFALEEERREKLKAVHPNIVIDNMGELLKILKEDKHSWTTDLM